MDRTDGYYFPHSSAGGSTLTQQMQPPPGPGAYHQNEQPAVAAQHGYYGAPPPSDTDYRQQCFPPPQAPPFMSFPNDPWAWQQQNQAYLSQMQQYQQQQLHNQATSPFASNCIIPPPPQPPPPSLLLGQHCRLQPPPPPPNLDAILGALDVRYESEDDVMEVPASSTATTPGGGRKKAKTSETTAAAAATKDAAASASTSKSAASAATSSPAAAAASAATIPTIGPSSSRSSLASTSSIPSLLDGLRAEVAARSRPAPDLRSIEHAASILSSRTGKSPKRSSRRESSRSRRTEERSESRKENRAADSTRDKRREGRRGGGEERRRRDEGGERRSTRSRDSPSRRSHRSDDRSEQRSDHRERRSRTNGERREKERGRDRTEKEKLSSTDTAETSSPLKPSDIQLKLRECAKENDKGEVQVFLTSDDERDEQEGEGRDEYEDEDEEQSEEGEEEEGGAESDMDIESEGGESDDVDGSSSSFLQSSSQQQQYGSRSHSTADFWGSGCAPEDEEEHRLTPEVFFASGPSRRVNSPLYRESHRRARALASQALSEEYRERYDLISKHLRSRSVFRGLQSSCGPDAPKLSIHDPRPTSKHVQTFPCKESNVQYAGPDAFIHEPTSRPSIYKKGGGYPGASQGPYTIISRSKLVRAPAAAPSAPVAAAASPKLASLKRTIQNAPSASTTVQTTSASSTSVLSTMSSASTTTASAAAAAAPRARDGSPPAKISRVDELMAELLASVAPMRKAASEPRLDTKVTACADSDDTSLPLAISSPRALADRGSSASLALIRSPRPDYHASLASPGSSKAVVPPRSALSFRKIGEHVVRPGSKLCFEWAESGACKAGVFCNFEHGEGAARVEKKVCSRMLRGLCRGESHCPLPHGLLPHQMPICAHYLRCDCNHGPDECGLVHIKHNEKVPVCVFFNQGKCTKEDDCTFRHQYRSDVVCALGVHAPSGHPPPMRGPEQRGQRSSRLPKGRALLTAAAAARSTTPSAGCSPARSAVAAAAAASPAAPAAAAEEDTSTFDWIM
ncbi:hypothetical protein PMAYCL1PPCAC_01280 [Pristionchus mayeri]|uniref:C3H1-type domain-containing protein n=1 Tax=Pristionchus mayeri TaxID=1317129 RepID=A0AAN5C562_9BILA|nr:hypothetical protein PMAYCL1PPCAC_01280 [Pristionchus mayeri]